MTQPLEQSLLAAWPLSAWKNTRLLVAVSGGADSVALVQALVRVAESREFIHVAHFNHGWRGAESDEDERFVEDLCNELELPLICERAVADLAHSEQAARESRYEFLTKAAYSVGARYVVTAHTAGDRVETMLHNLCRGTGLSGIAAPTQFRNLHDELVLVRPLLRCSRSQIVSYLQSLGQSYREDSSNANTSFKRNYIRQRVLPLLREAYGDQVEGHLLSYSVLAEEATAALRQYAMRWLEEANGVSSGVGTELPASAFQQAPWPVVQLGLEMIWKQNRWPLQAMTRDHWYQIRDVCSHASSTTTWKTQLNLPGNLQLATMQGRVRIAQVAF